MIRVLGVTATALGLLFGGYWWAGSAAIGRGAAAVLDDLAAQGWTVRHDPIDTAGFPARFDLVLTGLDLRDPGDSFGWLMPRSLAAALRFSPERRSASRTKLFSVA